MKDFSTQGWLGVFLLMGSAQEALETLGADSTAAPALPAKGCQLSAVVVVGEGYQLLRGQVGFQALGPLSRWGRSFH